MRRTSMSFHHHHRPERRSLLHKRAGILNIWILDPVVVIMLGWFHNNTASDKIIANPDLIPEPFQPDNPQFSPPASSVLVHILQDKLIFFHTSLTHSADTYSRKKLLKDTQRNCLAKSSFDDKNHSQALSVREILMEILVIRSRRKEQNILLERGRGRGGCCDRYQC